jgi:predicted acetyltransferase
MPHTTIRKMPKEEMLEVMHPLTSYAFHASPPLPDKEEWKEIVSQREGVTYFALFEGDAAVATVAGTAMIQQVRGALYDAGGIWGVATHPAARRKGYSKRLLASLLADLRQDGRPVSCLYPFRESFYEQLGYVAFPLAYTAKLAPASLSLLLALDLDGQVELVLIGDGYDTYRQYLHSLQQRFHGMALFVHGQKALLQKRNNFWLALAKAGGQLVGLMIYNLEGEEVTSFRLRAYRFYYDTSQAKYLLLQWIARHIDQASEVEIRLPPFELPETWLADMQIRTESAPRSAMSRILDVAKLGGMHTGPGCFSARVSDPLCPWNTGMWQFETVDGKLQVTSTERADCDLSIQALTALIYGAHDPGDFAIRGWGNPSPDLQAVMRTVFPSMLPFMHEMF